MTRGNRITEQLVLLLALACALGLGFGRLSEDLCSLGGSYADDPGTALVSEYALPARASYAENAAISAVAVPVFVVPDLNAGGDAGSVPRPAPDASFETPHRC